IARSLWRHGRASGLSFFPGWLTSELPLQAMAAQMVWTAGFAAAGALRTRKGKAGLLVTLASWAGLVDLYRTSTHAGEVLEAALVEALGPDYRARMAPEFAPPA